MKNLRLSQAVLVDLDKNWGFFLAWGVALAVLGILAISYAGFATLASVMTFGFLLSFAGIFVIIDSFHFWRGKGGSFFLQLLMGVLYLGVGLSFIFSPMLGSLSLTFLLAILFIILGIYRIFAAFVFGLPGWAWILCSGIITFLLGVLILGGWPTSALYIIGVFVGVDLLFLGINYIMLALTVRRH